MLDGLEVKVAFGSVWKESLGELSGGQRQVSMLIHARILFYHLSRTKRILLSPGNEKFEP